MRPVNVGSPLNSRVSGTDELRRKNVEFKTICPTQGCTTPGGQKPGSPQCAEPATGRPVALLSRMRGVGQSVAHGAGQWGNPIGQPGEIQP